VDILMLLRDDKESTLGGARRNKTALRQMMGEPGGGATPTFRVVDWTQLKHLRDNKPAEYQARVESGVRMLSGGRVVVTDRLHAAILSFLSLLPVFYVDQSYGKIRRSLAVAFNSSAACADEADVRVFAAASLEEALARAARFVEACKARGEC
jgi:exopolysaccharide biosynthesis predicted pyruvyltransferase EpsI